MLNEFSRTELLIGSDSIKKLNDSHVAIFGLGGVGSYAVEALARSGVGTLTLIDNDIVTLTNINRQLIATHNTLNGLKTDISKKRVLSINPSAVVNTLPMFFTKDNCDIIDFSSFSYIIDAIDTISSKLLLAEICEIRSIPIISCMGAGNKLDPTRFEVTDIYKTSVCPLAKVMRRELKRRNIKHLKVVYSKEEPIEPMLNENMSIENTNKRQTPGSIAFVPSVAGLIAAGEVIKYILSNK